MTKDDNLKLIAHSLSELFKSKSIPFKETEKQFTILCPSCLRDGKTKLKLNIDKTQYIYHCFRCGIKGSPLTLPSVLNQLGLVDAQHLFIDIITDSKFLTSQNKSFFDTYNSIKNELDIEFNREIYKKQILKNAKSTIGIFNQCCDKTDIVKRNLIKAYLQLERCIEPYQLNMYKINHIYGTAGKLNCRFVVPTYLYTNYEARTITSSTARYMKEVKSGNSTFFDYIFINIINGIQDNPFKRTTELRLPYVVITEGVFDALKLGMMGIPCISSGGVENFNKILIFLLILDKLYNTKVSNILYIYDRDIDMKKIESVRNDICFSFSKLYNFKFSRFNYEDYKDIGDIPPDKMYEFVSGIDDVISEFK